ncbi:LuxR family transcriptional regulator [Mangrovimicrobium sediminis]|uniref:LuxR family transcriptional regulator n=1 Tax=Mangrovimicrobium sediminis TaxID=2562682 RepID=A0A4Z0M5E3_9GAMM|nr:LuxR family transcriptional regulator [Haliea sp. SAOS-164]TGD74882.1 LuxR family transcriptional regulator [Haliea sp. SAOS-164]
MILEREEELRSLATAFASVTAAGGQIALVCGEAGIGKSSLIAAFLDSLQAPHRQATGYCDPLTTPRPLGPLRDIGARLLGPDSGGADDTRYFDDLIYTLAAARQPVVLVIEDLHWADERTLDWLRFIGRRITTLPLLLICSFRDDEVDAAHPLRAALGLMPGERKRQLTLAPLSLDAIRQLAPGPGLAPRRLLQVTAGNPFFVAELLAQRDALDQVPHSVADAIHTRLSGLPGNAVALLEYAACWPGAVPAELLQELPIDAVDDALADALRHKLLVVNDGRLAFRHELVQRAIYDRLLAPQRQRAHALFLEALVRGGQADQLPDLVVHHAQGANDEQLLLRYAPLAAGQAAGFGAHREAAEFLAHAVRLADALPAAQAAAIFENWAYEAGLSQAIDAEVIAAREKAVALWREVDCPAREGENLFWLSRLHWYRGEAEQAQHYIEAAIGVLERGEVSAARGKAYALRAQFFMLQDIMGEAVEWGERALAIAGETGDSELRVHALNTVGSARLFRGDTRGEPQLRESLALSLQHGLHEQAARVYTNLSECLIELRDLAQAEQVIEEGIAFDTAHDLDAWTYYLVGRKAQLRFEQDRYDEAATIAGDVLGRDNQTLLMRMPALIILARAGLRTGSRDSAARLMQALEAAGKIAEPQYLVPLRVAEIEQAVLCGTPADGRAAQAWLAGLDPQLLSPRKRAEALFWAELAGLNTGPVATADLPRAFALFFAGDAVAASAAFEDESSVYLAAWALVHEGGAASLQRADQLFEQAGALAARRCLRARLDGSPAAARLAPMKRGPYRAARKHPSGLTGKEQIVLGHLVQGSSNAAIAAAMGRSQRTVEKHVSSILAKLQAKNRVDLALRIKSEPWLLGGSESS